MIFRANPLCIMFWFLLCMLAKIPNNRDFVCSIEGGRLKPYSKTVNFNLVPTNQSFTLPSDPALSKRSVWSIPSTELVINNQTAATKNRNDLTDGKSIGELLSL